MAFDFNSDLIQVNFLKTILLSLLLTFLLFLFTHRAKVTEAHIQTG